MMRGQNHFDSIKSFVDFSYKSFGNSLSVSQKPFNPISPELGYCFKYQGLGVNMYRIVTAPTGDDFADFRVLMHEYGHIYLGHLEGIHEELDERLAWTIQNRRTELIEHINNKCKIDYADKLIERVIDDPVLNHSLHNIAMDMEVNSKVLSDEDVDEMEKRITAVLPKYDEEYLRYLQDKTEDEQIKKDLQDRIDKMAKESKIKLILPCRYHTPDGQPFPDELTYPEYLMMIVENLDEFVKMLISIKNGGNGDTSQVSDQELQEALNGQQGQGQGQGQQSQGQGQGGQGGQGGSGMQSFDDLMRDCGLLDGQDDKSNPNQNQDGKGKGGNNEPKESPYKGMYDGDDTSDKPKDKDGNSGSGNDHSTPERNEADKKRELGQIRSQGGLGCGKTGGPDVTRIVTEQDPIDMALEEVIVNFKSRVVKLDYKRDMMHKFNRGIMRSVIAPSYVNKITISTDPTIVFLIDISGSMDTALVDRCLGTISRNMKRIGKGLKYNIITWSTRLGEHIQNIDPRKPVPRISCGGGTRMAGGIEYFKEHYKDDAILILISDFEDDLQDWHRVEKTMPGYTMYGFNYGYQSYKQEWTNFKVKDFTAGNRRY